MTQFRANVTLQRESRVVLPGEVPHIGFAKTCFVERGNNILFLSDTIVGGYDFGRLFYMHVKVIDEGSLLLSMQKVQLNKTGEESIKTIQDDITLQKHESFTYVDSLAGSVTKWTVYINSITEIPHVPVKE